MSGSTAVSYVDGSVAERAAEAVLHAAGGRTVLLRMPAKASASDAEQLGLATPLFQDAPIGPVAFRKVGSTKTLLVSARSVRTTLHAVGGASAEALFLGAVGLRDRWRSVPDREGRCFGQRGAAVLLGCHVDCAGALRA